MPPVTAVTGALVTRLGPAGDRYITRRRRFGRPLSAMFLRYVGHFVLSKCRRRPFGVTVGTPNASTTATKTFLQSKAVIVLRSKPLSFADKSNLVIRNLNSSNRRVPSFKKLTSWKERNFSAHCPDTVSLVCHSLYATRRPHFGNVQLGGTLRNLPL